jgi:large subunit ribosomal protein L17
MRHGVSGRRFNRPTNQRLALYRNQVTEVLKYESITTTEPKAKEIRIFVDRMITLGKKGSLEDRRRALAFIYSEEVVNKVFSEIAPRYATRNGGYTRVIKLGMRTGDGAPMAKLELVKQE